MHDLFDICDCDGAIETQHSVPQMPLIGDAAPAFTATTTNGTVNFPDDYAGKWVILFSHPSDFTPVCTSEFMAFQSMMDEFRELNTDIIGLSVGSLSSHLAWLNAIHDIKFNGWDNLNITFPVIDDTKMTVAKMYGMIQPNASDTHAVRAVFFIDPAGIIRTILYYPASVGRNFSEILRTLVALQTTDAFHVSTPADWEPGRDILVASPTTTDAMRKILRDGDKNADVHAWFLTSRKLGADEIRERLTRRNQARTTKPKKK